MEVPHDSDHHPVVCSVHSKSNFTLQAPYQPPLPLHAPRLRLMHPTNLEDNIAIPDHIEMNCDNQTLDNIQRLLTSMHHPNNSNEHDIINQISAHVDTLLIDATTEALKLAGLHRYRTIHHPSKYGRHVQNGHMMSSAGTVVKICKNTRKDNRRLHIQIHNTHNAQDLAPLLQHIAPMECAA